MLKNFVLGTEIAREGNFDIANISMTINECNLVEGIDYLKFGGVTLLNKDSLLLPNYIVAAMYSENITDMSDYLPYSWFMDQLENQTALVEDMFEIVSIGAYTSKNGKDKKGKRFVKILDEKLHDVLFNEKLVKYVADSKEIDELVNDKYIVGSMKLSNKKYLTWY